MPFCLTEAEALAVHAEMDFLSQGFVDLFPMSPARTGTRESVGQQPKAGTSAWTPGALRMPFVLQRGSLASYRSCSSDCLNKGGVEGKST